MRNIARPRRPARFDDPRRPVLVATILGSSMAFIDASVVTVALPTIGRDLDLGLAGRQWVFLAYSLVLASLYLIAGAAGDRFGEGRVFAGGILGFAAASALAGAAPTGGFLIGARALQGVAGAFVTTGSLAYLRATYGRASGRAVGLWTAWTGITTILGPPLGGALVEFASWRAIFYLNLPLAALSFLLARAARARDGRAPVEAGRSFDVAGALLQALALGALTYLLVEGGRSGFGGVWWAAVLAAAGAVAFGVFERRTRQPMLPFSLFRRRNFSVANGVTLLVYAGLSGSTFFLVLYLQSTLGYSPLQASLVMVPVSLVMLVLAGRFGALADRQGPRLYLTVGPLVTAGGVVAWALVEHRSEWWLVAIGALVFALGLSITVAPITATALGAVPDRYAGIASGVNNTVSRVGGLVAVALIGLVIAQVAAARGGAGTPLTREPTTATARRATVDGYRAGMLLAAGLMAAGGLIAGAGFSNADATNASREAEESTSR